MQQLRQVIDAAWEERATFTPSTAKAEVREAVEKTITLLDTGKLRIVAIAAPKRVGGRFAGVPTWKEQGYDAVMPSYRMFIAARGLDAAQRRYWDGVFAKLARSEAWQKELAANEWQGSYMNSANSVKYLEARYAEYKRILTELKLAK